MPRRHWHPVPQRPGSQRVVAFLAVLVLGLALAAAAAERGQHPGRLPVQKLSWSELARGPEGAQKLDAELRRQRIAHQRWHQVHDLLGEQHLSRRGAAWLSERGLGPARVADPHGKTSWAGVDTLRILLVRISFETNREPDLVTMASDGDFFFEPRFPPDEPLQIDPEPHDKAFFQSHLRGLAEYYQFQSGGRLHIESRVLPEGDRDSYKLSDVADYGPGAGQFWTLEGLESLVRDMITATDAGTQADGSADLSDYDDDNDLTYIIFAHAGSDWQSDINQDSPNDIPTFFVTLGEPQAISGGQLSECSVIPETTTQDGFKGSIAAALYHEFGHALGLPDVYDATTGLTSCGVWDLMDSGTNLAATLGYVDEETGELVGEAVTGILPPSLSAWCKWFLGWVQTEHVTGGEGETAKLPAVGVPRDRYSLHNQVAGNAFDLEQPQVLLGGMSSREFFLLENRWVPRGVEDTPYDPYDPETNYGGLYFKTDTELNTGVVLYLAGDRRGVEGINTGYYDYFLPEGGMLVWHADMDRIENGLALNTINEFGDGLKLLEADGIQDIGVLDAYVLGWYGSDRDPFSPWNEAGYLEILPEGAGRPTSRAFDRSFTGLHVRDIADDGQAHGAVLSLQASLEPLAAGWPAVLPPSGTEEQPAPRTLDPATVISLALADAPGRVVLAADRPSGDDPTTIFAWSDDGAAAYDGGVNLPPGAAVRIGSALAGVPALVAHEGAELLAVGGRDGELWFLEARADALAGVASATLEEGLQTGPQPVPVTGAAPLICVVDQAGDAWLLDRDAQVIDGPLPVTDLGSDQLVAPLRVLAGPAGSSVLFMHAGGWRLQPVTAAGFGPDGTVWNGRLEGPVQPALVPVGSGWRLLAFGADGLLGAWQIDAAGSW